MLPPSGVERFHSSIASPASITSTFSVNGMIFVKRTSATKENTTSSEKVSLTPFVVSLFSFSKLGPRVG